MAARKRRSAPKRVYIMSVELVIPGFARPVGTTVNAFDRRDAQRQARALVKHIKVKVAA